MRADAGHSGKLNSIAYEGKEEKKKHFPQKSGHLEIEVGSCFPLG